MDRVLTVKGVEVLVDDDMYEYLSSMRWHLSGLYVATMVEGKSVRMHNVVAGTPLWGMHTDHINQNKMDNRRANLRTVPAWENMQNYGSHRDAGSPHRGVSWSRNNKGWIAQCMIAGKRVHLGTFTSEDAAAEALERYRAEVHHGH